MKRYVVGDIHGCYEELCKLLHYIEKDAAGEKYKIIFVGDYVDRGPKSKEVVELIQDLQKIGHYAIMGNHEDMLINGELMYAKETLKSFHSNHLPKNFAEWMQSLPKYYEDETIFVAHAGMQPMVSPSDQTDIWLLWYRYERGQPANMGKHFYHGHTPAIGWVEGAVDRTNVDTGCVYGGHLTAAIVSDNGTPEGFIQVMANDSHYH